MGSSATFHDDEAIKRLRTRSAAVRHWRDFSLNFRLKSRQWRTAADLVRRRFIADDRAPSWALHGH